MKSSALIVLIVIAFSSAVWGQISDFPHTNFSKADSVAELYPAHSLEDLKGLADKLTAPLLTDQEKFRSIFKWVCSNIEVDYALVIENKRKRATLHGDRLIRWNKKFNVVVFERLLNDHKTLCTGYAYLVRELAAHAGLRCEIVNGYAKPGGIMSNGRAAVNHSWNVIQLNQKWYVCDATWSSGIYDRSTGRFVKKYNDRFFLTDSVPFSQEHRAVRHFP